MEFKQPENSNPRDQNLSTDLPSLKEGYVVGPDGKLQIGSEAAKKALSEALNPPLVREGAESGEQRQPEVKTGDKEDFDSPERNRDSTVGPQGERVQVDQTDPTARAAYIKSMLGVEKPRQ